MTTHRPSGQLKGRAEQSALYCTTLYLVCVRGTLLARRDDWLLGTRPGAVDLCNRRFANAVQSLRAPSL